MIKTKNGLYILISALIAAGYIWLFFNLHHQQTGSICLFKNILHIPCPSCGITRGIILIVQGHFTEGVLLNPLCLVVLTGLISFPFLILLDLIFRKELLLRLYERTEHVFRRAIVYIPSLILIFSNWLWNIHKQL